MARKKTKKTKEKSVQKSDVSKIPMSVPPKEDKPEPNFLEIFCPYCGSKDFVKRGTRQKKLGKVQLYRCNDCGRAIIIIGARQVGKTTLSDILLKERTETIIKFNGDNPSDRDKLNNKDLEELIKIVGDKKIIFIGEAQKINTIGQTIKLLVDGFKEKKQIIATGSSSINLLDKTAEPLTARKVVFHLHPLSLKEIYPEKNLLLIHKELSNNLIYGSYPGIVKLPSNVEKEDMLGELCESYLFKDILEFQKIKNATVLYSLLKALALQIGSEVSYNELSNIIGIEKKTIERYIDLLEKNFIVFRLSPYAINKRRTISKLRKVYFYDLGIRNAIINNFNALDSRNDVGELWENFAFIERIKYLGNKRERVNNYFLRTYDGAGIDLIEEKGGALKGFEFKFSVKLKKTAGKTAGLNYIVITPNNMEWFLN